MNIRDLQNKIAVIQKYQSTFMVLNVEDKLLRFDCIQKQEFKITTGDGGTLLFLDQHPLLLDYNEGFKKTYINSRPDSIDLFLEEFKIAIEELLDGWRNWTRYVTNSSIRFSVDNFVNNVKNGTGQLSYAPCSINERILAVCRKYNVDTVSFGEDLKKEKYNLLTIGDNNYVIAKEFRFRSL